MKQFVQAASHIWEAFTLVVIEATAAVKTEALILVVVRILVVIPDATILPDVPSKEIVATVFDVPLGERNIFCKYTKELETYGFNTKSADENKSTAEAPKKNKASAFKRLFLLSISDWWRRFLRTNMVNT